MNKICQPPTQEERSPSRLVSGSDRWGRVDVWLTPSGGDKFVFLDLVRFERVSLSLSQNGNSIRLPLSYTTFVCAGKNRVCSPSFHNTRVVPPVHPIGHVLFYVFLLSRPQNPSLWDLHLGVGLKTVELRYGEPTRCAIAPWVHIRTHDVHRLTNFFSTFLSSFS